MLIGPPARGTSKWEAGALFRVGLASIERMVGTPVIVAPGAYIARRLRSGGPGTRWSLKMSYSHAWYSGFRIPAGSTSRQPQGDRLTMGLGWYQ